MAPVDDLTGQAGRLEALLDPPEPRATSGDVRAAVVLAHPHPQLGGSMHTKVVYQAAKGLSRIGCAVLRFNFRGVGTSAGTFADGAGEQADFGSALDYMAARFPGVRLWAGGFSFGAWVAMEVGASDERVSALIGIAPPVATSFSGREYDFTATLQTDKAKFLVQGELDDICPLEALWVFYGQLREPKELIAIDAADHLFAGRTQEVGEALGDLLGDY